MRFILAFRNYKDFKMHTLVDQLTRTKQKILRLETKHWFMTEIR